MSLSSYLKLLYRNDLDIRSKESQLYIVYNLPDHPNDMWDKWDKLPKFQ